MEQEAEQILTFEEEPIVNCNYTNNDLGVGQRRIRRNAMDELRFRLGAVGIVVEEFDPHHLTLGQLKKFLVEEKGSTDKWFRLRYI